MNHLFTGMNGYVSSDEFYYLVQEQLPQVGSGSPFLSLGTVDIDHFNYVNDLLGFETGDLILQKIAAHFSSLLTKGSFFTRLHADIFSVCAITPEQEDVETFFSSLLHFGEQFQDMLPTGYHLTASCGVITMRDGIFPASTSALLDKANYARQKAKCSQSSALRFYDDKTNEELQWQKTVTFSMEPALENHEFELYLQPKVATKSGQVSGAEALVRWNHPQLGMIMPNRFIPIMEQSGLIQKLDFFMLEEACRFLNRCARLKMPQLPVSVNFSKAHLTNENLVNQIFHTVNQAGLATGLIEIEFTESIFTDGFEQLIDIVSDLKLLGFRVSLDDFGSAYSSLNCLKNLPIDIIKIDKGFLQTSANTEKGQLIIAKVVEMIKSLRMLSIMEGVETLEQVEFLRKLSCDFIQGYFFAKPMPQDAYIDYLKSSHTDPQRQKCTDASPCADKDHLHTIPQEFQQDITEEPEQLDALKKSLTDQIAAQQAIIQSEREARQSLHISEEHYRVILEQSDNIMFDWDFATDTVHFSARYAAYFGQSPVWVHPRQNPTAQKNVHPTDFPLFEQWLHDTYHKCGSHKAEFRYLDINGNYVWLRGSSTAICDTGGRALRAVGLLTNINAQKTQLDALTYKSQRDPLTKALNKEEIALQAQALLNTAPNVTGAFFMIDIDNFKALNDNLGHQLGDSVLVELTNRLTRILPENSLIGRMGGDELGVYLHDVTPQQVHTCAETLVSALRIDYYGSTGKYCVSASVGVALHTCGVGNFDDLYYRADIALYESKRGGKDRYSVYQDGMTGALLNSRTPVDWSDGFLNAYFLDDFPFKIFEMLYETRDIDASINMILQILGTRFQMDRVYIFQNDGENCYTNNTYEWCAPCIPPEMGNLQHMPIGVLHAYLSQYSAEGVYRCPDIRQAPSEVYDLCAPQGIKSMLHCAIHNEGRQVGFIGFDMCTAYHDWSGEEIAILGYISRILSVFLLKADMTQELQRTYQNYVEMVENLGGFVYVVDPKTYEVLYMNNATRALGVSTEVPCYQMAFGAEQPCHNCPLNQLSDTKKHATEEIYSVLLEKWVSSSASQIKWEGKRDAGLVCCMDISKYKASPPKPTPVPAN